MQRLMPRVTQDASVATCDVAQESVALAEPTVQRAPMASRPARALKPVSIPLEAMYPSTPQTAAPAVASGALLQGCKTVQIMHNGEPYTLRATKHGKLILTK